MYLYARCRALARCMKLDRPLQRKSFPHSTLGWATLDEAYIQDGEQPDPGLAPDQAAHQLHLVAWKSVTRYQLI